MSNGRPADTADRSRAPRRAPVIAVVGSANVDLVASTARVPDPGETIIGDRFAVAFGGKGANQAVMAARLGARVWLLARVGDDAYGTMTIADLEAEGVETSLVRRARGATGVASIWVEPDGTNRIVVIPGANLAWGSAATAARDVARIPRLDAVLGQLEIPQAVTAAAFSAARARGAATILNPAPAGPLLPDLLASTDWLIPNETEFAALAAQLDVRGATTEERLADAANRQAPRLVITLGARGAVIVRRGRASERVPAPEVAAVDSTGAGDAFVGGFATVLAAGRSETEAVQLGIRCASESVTRPGARASYPRPAAMVGP